jgi:hypothetical protein
MSRKTRERRERRDERLETPRPARVAPRPPFLARRRHGVALAILVFVLAATAEERTFGTISDEQQMLATSVAMTESGELGIARGQLFMVHRAAGDALAPYGMGQPLVEMLPSFLAGGFEKRYGGGASQTLFVALEVALVALAAWGAGLAALALGASETGFLVALFGTGLGSPRWAYTGSGYSEPLQAACLALAFAFAARAARSEAARRAALLSLGAGALAALSVLGKSLNVVVAPLVLAPVLLDGHAAMRRRVRLGAFAAAGATPVLALWLVFELVRFGRPFASYGGANFTHPFLDGVWRLAIGPSKGLLLYFPLAALAAVGLVRLARSRETRGSAVAVAGTFLVLLALAASWWAWDGTVGWGPRLLVPAISLLGAVAGVAVARLSSPLGPRIAIALAGAGVVVNALGVFQSEAATAAYLSKLPPVAVTDKEAAAYPSYILWHDAAGRRVLSRQFAAASDAGLAPVRVHLFLLGARLFANDARDVERRLSVPPWSRSRPELVPGPKPLAPSASLAAYEVAPFAWPHLFSATSKPRDARADAFATAWDAALADQALREMDVGRPERALPLAERLLDVSPSGYTAALYAEALRALGRRDTLQQFLGSLPKPFLSSPSLGVVEALAARDQGDEAAARRILGDVSGVFPRPGIAKALGSPMSSWPASLHAMTGENLSDRPLARPRFGR